MSWIDVDQNTPQWEQLKVGVVSTSVFSAIMAKHKQGIWGKTALKLAGYIAKERVTGEDCRPKLKGDQFGRGHRLEPIAVKAYEDYTGLTTSKGGFYLEGGVGSSPDIHVGKHGLAEIKTRTKELQLVRLRNLNPDPSTKAQIQGQLLLSNKKYCDFVSYCEEFPIEDYRRLFVYRVFPDIEYQTILDRRLLEFEELINEEIKNIQL